MDDSRLNTVKSISTVASVLIIPIALAYIGNGYTSSLKDREIQSQYVKLAVEILQAEPTVSNKSVRAWATKVIDRYSGVPLGAEAEKALVEKVTISALDKNRCWAAPTSDELKDVQEMLKKLGLYKGDITGVCDSATTDAVTDFQRKSNTFVDGILGKATLNLLRSRVSQP
jgi:hypothetical protein